MAKAQKEKKIFVLDTSVIIYEHNSILNFDEHDVGIPITVLEELDNFKKGNDTKNFEAREFIRLIDKLAKGQIGAYEAALLNTPMAKPDQPLEILRTIHSFDPCLACASHVISPQGEEITRVTIR